MKEYFISAVIAAGRKIGEFFGAFVGGRTTVPDIIDEGSEISRTRNVSLLYGIILSAAVFGCQSVLGLGQAMRKA